MNTDGLNTITTNPTITVSTTKPAKMFIPVLSPCSVFGFGSLVATTALTSVPTTSGFVAVGIGVLVGVGVGVLVAVNVGIGVIVGKSVAVGIGVAVGVNARSVALCATAVSRFHISTFALFAAFSPTQLGISTH